MKLQFLFFTFFISITSIGQSLKDTSRATIAIDQVIVSANKVEESSKTISRQVKVISGRDIGLLQIQNTADILSNSGSVSVQKSQQGGGSPVIRGFEASRVLLLIDGVRMNNLIYRAGHLQNIITVDENTLDHIEVLYGPASTVYGSDALGGVISLYTKNPVLKDSIGKTASGGAFFKYGSVNEGYKTHVDFNLASKHWASLTSISYSKFGDLKMGSKQNGKNAFFGGRPYYADRINGADSLVANEDSLLQKFTAYQQIDLLQKILFQPTDRLKHIVNIQFSTSSDIPRYDRLTDTKGEELKYADWYYGPQRRLLVGYNFNAENFFAGQNIHVGLHFQDLEESRHQRKFDANDLQHRIEHVQIVNFNTDLNSKIGRGYFHYGVEVEYDWLKSTANSENIVTGEKSPLDTRYPNGKNSMYHSDAYSSYTMAINKSLSWNAGLRFGYSNLNSSQSDTTFYRFPYSDMKQKNFTYSGSVGTVYFPIPKVKLYLNFGSGYRVPNIDDLSKIFESGDGILIVPNENLEPEKTLTSDVGLSLLLWNKIRFENTIFYSQIYNAIVTSDYKYNGQDSVLYDGTMSKVMANQNLRDAYIYGYSGNIKTGSYFGFAIYAGFNYTYGRISTDSTNMPLDHIPPVYGIIGIQYLTEKLFIDANIQYNGFKNIKDYSTNGEDNEQYAPEGGTPAWYTINLRASYNITKLITVQAGIENLLDIQYRVFASGMNSPGRNIYGMLKVRL